MHKIKQNILVFDHIPNNININERNVINKSQNNQHYLYVIVPTQNNVYVIEHRMLNRYDTWI